jgi:hypothetical protein
MGYFKEFIFTTSIARVAPCQGKGKKSRHEEDGETEKETMPGFHGLLLMD